MASNRLLERKLQEGPILGTSATKLDFCKHKYSLLILIGRTGRSDQAGNLRKEIERGIRSWDVDLTSCDLNLYLQEFLSHHTVSFKGAGQRCLRYSNKVLETHVLISPPQEQVHTEVRGLLGSDSAHKLLVLAGQSVEDSGELLLPRGLFSPHQLEHILADLLAGVENAGSPPAPELTLTLSCPSAGQWETVLPGRGGGGALSLRVTVNVNPPEVLPAMEAVGAFAGLVQGSLGPAAASPFEQLPPPGTVGFLKLSRPCCYVFPGGGGDCAFFAVCGFTVLADGGSDAAACFWRLVRHLDRVDALLLTHAGAGNLPGVNALLERKVAEREVAADVRGGRVKMTDDLSKKLISPELGVVFFNVPSHLQKMEQPPCTDAVLRAADQAALTARLLQELEMVPQPLVRPRTVPVEPLTLFQKMGVGQLDLYALSPESGPDAAPPASACVLLVWRPACPQEKVVRVLFPGVTPQEKILEGLEGLRGLAFMRRPTVTAGELEEGLAGDGPTGSAAVGREAVRKEAPPTLGKEKQGRDEAKDKGKGANEGKRGSDRTKVKDALKQKAAPSDKNGTKKGNRREVKKDEKVVKRDESGPKRREQVRRDGLSNKPKNESNTKPKKEAKNDSRTVGKKAGKPSEKEMKTDSNVNAKKAHMGAEPPLNALPKSDKEREHVNGCEKEQQNGKTKSEESPCDSKMSTPEDMTADFLRLKEETEREEGQVESPDKGKEKGSGLGSLGKDPDVPDIPGEQTVVTQGNIRQEKTQAEDRMDADPEIRVAPAAGDHTRMAEKPPKVVGFPSPFKRPSVSECEDQQDRTPTEYTLLDGALRNSPPYRSSPETQGPASPDEETVEPDSPDSRPNSAGHTPYCLSPNDVWCPRGTQGNLSETPEDVPPPGGLGPSDGQPPRDPRSAPDGRTTSNAREKHSFLSLGSLKEGGHDPSPSVATTTTTTTTHSMPAEVSSPQSTEVDESLSMSFEQGPTTVSQREGEDGMHRSHSNGGHFADPDFRVGISMKKPLRPAGQGPETGRPPGPPNALHFEAAAHDVDLCLVSPCEFKHFKLPDSEPPRDALAPQHHGNSNGSSNNPRDASASESNAPLCTEDCPSTTADGALDSDDEKSCSEPSHSLHDHPTNPCLPTDPLPAPPRDGPPLPPQPDSCMPVPRLDSEGKKMGTNATGKRGKRPPGQATEASHRPGSGGPTQAGKGRPQNGGVKGPSKDNRSASRNSSSSSRTTTQTTSLSGPGAKSGCCGDLGVYVDLAYLPSGASCPTVDVDFFRSVRSSCYIISGDSPQREQLMRRTLDALLRAKASWPDPMQVTLIPTFESVPMQEWYQQTMDKQRELDITVLGSNSTVAMQDETFPACKIEF